MFSTENLYRLFKPLNNENLITNYEVIIGGTNLPANLVKGSIILTPLLSENLSSQYKDLKNLIVPKSIDINQGIISEYSVIQNTYQVDIYKVNAPNLNYIEVEREAIKIREWLKSYETIEYLETLNSQILPNYSVISFSSEQYNKLFANRATFEFQILTLVKINESVNLIDKFKIENIILNKE
ncbi:hypothetical protein [Campylobacter jejuni]|uniref:hypothetical protein n=1 Tax=Campylobacter jejuni TaxID=197 RepID=UPI00073DF1C4|nr:hypothetical protein [Campylobacter jejuni]ALW15612.1 hypothetical protein RC26_02655 [Campylobacter jejuni]